MTQPTTDPFEALREAEAAFDRANAAYRMTLENEFAVSGEAATALQRIYDAQEAFDEALSAAYPPHPGQ